MSCALLPPPCRLCPCRRDPGPLLRRCPCIVRRSLPRATRLLYLHAYQSYLWNVAVTRRLRDLGDRAPVVGDLVLANPGELTSLSGEAEAEAEDGADPVAEAATRPTEEGLDDEIMDVPVEAIAAAGGSLV